ncbi:MAG: hypothetical protein ACT4NY_05765 [Pseudonocardiales bacterium]
MTGQPTPGRRRPGPIYDDAMKVLADDDLAAVLSMVGVDSAAGRLNVELTSSSMRADLLASTTDGGIVHVEFVKDPTPDLGLRMAGYRLRLLQDHPRCEITQFMLALRDDVGVPDSFVDDGGGRLRCEWTVIRIGDLDPATLLRTPTTAAVAALAHGTQAQRRATFAAAADLISAHTDPKRGSVLLAAAATLASIVLLIETVLKEVAMPVLVRDTPLGRQLYEEFHKEAYAELHKEVYEGALQEGRQEGQREGRHSVVRLLLRRRFGDDPRIEAVARRLVALPDEEWLARLHEASSLDDLDR